jgi:hypothetical protein
MYRTLCPAHAPRPHKISDLCSKMVNFVCTIIGHLVKYFPNSSTLVSDLTPNCQGSSLAASELLFSTPEHVEMNQFIFGQLCHQVWCPNNNIFWKKSFRPNWWLYKLGSLEVNRRCQQFYSEKLGWQCFHWLFFGEIRNSGIRIYIFLPGP